MFFKVISCFLLIILNVSVEAGENRLIIASTTSVHDTGLLDYLNKEFNKEYKILIQVLALGTGQAIIVAKQKGPGLTGGDIKAMTSEILGVAKSMGLSCEGKDPKDIQASIKSGSLDERF